MDRRTWIATVLKSGGALSLASLLPGAAPQFFTPAQLEQLTAIGERIIPGSAAANCALVIDAVMTVETNDKRQQLLDALAAFKNFRALSTEQQNRLLTELAADSGHDAPFTLVKEWVADTYWSSQAGLRELGWKGQVAWSNPEMCDRS